MICLCPSLSCTSAGKERYMDVSRLAWHAYSLCVCAIWFSLGACVIQIISRVMRVYLSELEDKKDKRYMVSASNKNLAKV